MSLKEKDPCAEQRADQIEKNCDQYFCMVHLNGEVAPGADQSALIQQLMGTGTQHPDRVKQVADYLLRCPPLPSNGRAKKKIWYDENNEVTDDPALVCRVVEVGTKDDDDSCPTSHIGQDIVDIARKANESYAAVTLLGGIPPEYPDAALDGCPHYELCVTGNEQQEWQLPPELHPSWDSLGPLEQCLTDVCFARMITPQSPLAGRLVNGFDENGCGIANPMPPVNVPVYEWVNPYAKLPLDGGIWCVGETEYKRMLVTSYPDCDVQIKFFDKDNNVVDVSTLDGPPLRPIELGCCYCGLTDWMEVEIDANGNTPMGDSVSGTMTGGEPIPSNTAFEIASYNAGETGTGTASATLVEGATALLGCSGQVRAVLNVNDIDADGTTFDATVSGNAQPPEGDSVGDGHVVTGSNPWLLTTPVTNGDNNNAFVKTEMEGPGTGELVVNIQVPDDSPFNDDWISPRVRVYRRLAIEVCGNTAVDEFGRPADPAWITERI